MKAPMLPPFCPSCKCSIKIKMSMELSGMILRGKTEVIGEKAVPLPLRPPHFSHGPARDRTGPLRRKAGDKPPVPRDARK
jgi:hypothetical protein